MFNVVSSCARNNICDMLFMQSVEEEYSTYAAAYGKHGQFYLVQKTKWENDFFVIHFVITAQRK